MQFVMDGNFAAEHQRMKNPEDDLWLADGEGYFVGRKDYKEHLSAALETYEVVVHMLPVVSLNNILSTTQKSTCNEYKAVNSLGKDRHSLDSTGIGATVCARHGCFVPHSVVNFQVGKRSVTNILSWYEAHSCSGK